MDTLFVDGTLDSLLPETSLARADLLPGEQLAVDGSVIRAASSCKASKSRKGLKRRVEKLGEVIESKLLEESSDDSTDALRRQKARLERALEEMTALGKSFDEKRMTITEPEASRKKLKNGNFAPAHNVQVVTDMSSGAIIHTEIIEQNNDCAQLAPQLRNAQKELERVSAQCDGPHRPRRPRPRRYVRIRPITRRISWWSWPGAAFPWWSPTTTAPAGRHR